MGFQELKNSGNQFYLYDSGTDQGIKSLMDGVYAQSITYNQAFWTEADLDHRFEAGEQSVWGAYLQPGPSWQSQVLAFNHIRPTINLVTGYERRNRKSIIVVPQENGDQETADQYSQCMLWSMNQESVLETVSDAFHGAIICGMNLLSVWMDFRSDPVNGDLRTERIPYNSFLIDPFWTKMDLSDCNYLWTRKWLSKEQLTSIMPSQRELIDAMTPPRGNFDGKFQYQPQSYNYPSASLFACDEFWYRSNRTIKLLCDVVTGETMEWKRDPDTLEDFLKQFPQIIAMDHEIQTVKLCIRVQDRVFYNGPNPLGIDSYPFVPVVGYYSPEIAFYPWRCQGIVRGLRDPQYLYNRRKKIELDILESQINSGWKYKEDALVNPMDIFLSGQGKGLALKSTANMEDVQRIESPIIPPTTMQVSAELSSEIGKVSGVNEELLGSAVDDKAGILSMLRQGAGLTTLQKLFDSLDVSKKLLGRIYLQAIQANWSPGKVQRIIAKQPSPQFYNKAFGKYDSAVEEGVNTTTQRQLQFTQLMALKEAGLPIPPNLLIEATTIQNKKQLTDALEAQEQSQNQMVQMQMQMAMQEQQSKVAEANARAKANVGLALERASRVQENRALAQERLSESEKDRDQAVLNQVKTLKELESMDLGEIERLLAIQMSLKNLQSSQEVEEQAMVETPNVEELAVAQTGGNNGTGNIR